MAIQLGKVFRFIDSCSASAFAALVVLALGTELARGFEVSGLQFNDLHLSQSSPPPRYNAYAGNGGNGSQPVPTPPRETFHAFTPEDLARQAAQNNARYRQAIALLKPAPQIGSISGPASLADSLQPSGPAFLGLAGGSKSGDIPWSELDTCGLTAESLAIVRAPEEAKPHSSRRSPYFEPKEERRGPTVRIGGAGEMRGEVFMVMPGSTEMIPLEPGRPVYQNAHIVTHENSRLQVMLLDQTVLVVGPGSDIILDEFVYDPDTSVAKVTARLTKGVFRFVSGKVAREGPSRMKVTVPTGTIGIRGTEFQVDLDGESQKGHVKLYYGKLEITEDRTGRLIEMSSGQILEFGAGPDGGFGEPAPMDSNPASSRIDAFGRALFLLRAAANVQGVDDREFLVQMAGSAMEGQRQAIDVPRFGGMAEDEARRFYSTQLAVEETVAAFFHFRREHAAVGEAKGDLTAVLKDENDAKAAVEDAWKARQALVESGRER